jgi:hypothetical protein
MTEIIEKMDEWTSEHFQGTSPFIMKLWGHCELAKRSSQGDTTVGEQPVPMTINGTSDREYVTIDDRYDFISWWRTPTSVVVQNTIDGNDWGFGFDSGRVQKITFRWVIAWKVEHGEMIALNLASELPTALVIDGYQFVSVDKINTTIDHDDEAIYLTELGNTVYEKWRSTWNLAVVNLVAEYILDPDCIHDFGCGDEALTTENSADFVDESSDCLIQE